MNLHEEFYNFRDKVWKAFEELVHEGCDINGQLPICMALYSNAVFLPYKLTRKCPFAVISSCIKMRSVKPWQVVYEKPYMTLLLTSVFFIPFIYLIIKILCV